MQRTVDLLIIGGGINGTGIARDAAGRGRSVLLCEMGDLASATSSWSSKLIHGGLRYLEYYEFRLVREALMEREVLWRIAPHIINPLRLVLPYRKGLRPAWLLRLGLFLYDHLGGRKLLPPTRVLDLTTDTTGKPLKANVFRKGFEYSDCRVDDSRLVMLNARDAADRGAEIRTRTRAMSARRDSDGWTIALRDERTGQQETVTARTVVNAAGPWVGSVLTGQLGMKSRANTRLVQGSHIVVRKLYEHDRAYILQNLDGRIVFVIPFEGDFTLIGTTDRDYVGDPAKVAATAEDIDYLCQAVSENLERAVAPKDVVWAFSGVRPLYDDGASEAKAATRDYVLELDAEAGKPALLSVFGGKITTARHLAEEAVEKLGLCSGQTRDAHLPGGNIGNFDIFLADVRRRYPFLTSDQSHRMARAYGSMLHDFVQPDMGEDFGGGLMAREVDWLVVQEWATTVDDIIWRRTKLGLVLSQAQAKRLLAYLDQ